MERTCSQVWLTDSFTFYLHQFNSVFSWNVCNDCLIFFGFIILRQIFCFVGGLEGVIVVWQLDTGKRRYKPRLGSPLLFFVDSPDSSISCVSVLLLASFTQCLFSAEQIILLIYEVLGSVFKWKFSESCFSLAQKLCR